METHRIIDSSAHTMAERREDSEVNSVEKNGNKDREVRVRWRDRNNVERGLQNKGEFSYPLAPRSYLAREAHWAD